jgi:hypothetical protein
MEPSLAEVVTALQVEQLERTMLRLAVKQKPRERSQAPGEHVGFRTFPRLLHLLSNENLRFLCGLVTSCARRPEPPSDVPWRAGKTSHVGR